MPATGDQWGWHCGFYPGCEPGQHTTGSAETFEQARAGFETDWNALLPTRTEADFQACRDQRDFTERKYAAWPRREKLPSQQPSSLIRCPCGQTFDSHVLADNLIHVPHITEHHRHAKVHR